jgi:hypothetical protein
MKNKRTPGGFSFPEVVIAALFLMLSLVFIYSLISTSSRGAMDAYHETIAFTLAQEGLEMVAGVGFDSLNNQRMMAEIEGKLGTLGTFHPVQTISLPKDMQILYPQDYQRFERMVEVEAVDPRIFLVRVTVQLRENLLGKLTFRRQQIILEKLAGSEYE